MLIQNYYFEINRAIFFNVLKQYVYLMIKYYKYKVRLLKYVIWYVNNKFGSKGNVFKFKILYRYI